MVARDDLAGVTVHDQDGLIQCVTQSGEELAVSVAIEKPANRMRQNLVVGQMRPRIPGPSAFASRFSVPSQPCRQDTLHGPILCHGTPRNANALLA